MGVTFDALAIEVLKHDYTPVVYMELYCATCGGWRGASIEALPMMPCPQCATLREATTLASGYSRRPGQCWEQWEKPLSRFARAFVLSEDDDAAVAAAIADRERRKWKRGRERVTHYRKNGQLAVAQDAKRDFCEDA